MSDPWQRPPIATAPLSVVLTAHNAGGELEGVVGGWARQLDALQRPYEIILVDDGSSDDSGARADALALQLPSLVVHRHAAPRGLGAALRTGVGAARHPLLLCTTCDQQYRPEDLKVLLDAIDRVDLVTGCRAGRPAPAWIRGVTAIYRGFVRVVFGVALRPSPCWLGLSGWGRRWLARWVFGVRVHDPECAFRLFRRSVFRRLPIQTDGDFALVEILAKANFLGCLMDEVPVVHRPLPPGAPRAGPGRVTRDARRLFRNPDFGPAVLPPEVEADPARLKTSEVSESSEVSGADASGPPPEADIASP
jgi:glycosyltransferase involved in cell wall biosynthesis